MNPGIHLFHKPVGPTSFSLLREIGPAAGRLKLCHGGTLDPFASGLLLILAGEATKLFDYLHDVPKVYEATVRWGVETDNGDPHGAVVSTGDASNLSAEQLETALASFIGWHEQTPHVTSAKRVGGERAYVRAHRGETFDMPPSRVYLHEARWLEHDLPNQSRLRLVTRGGYYVRALARDLGRLIGCGAHLSTLHRAAIGPWEDPGPGKSIEVRGGDLLPWLASRLLTDQELGDLRQGRPIALGERVSSSWALPAEFSSPQPIIRGLHQERLVFLLREEADQLHALRGLHKGI